MSRLYSLGIVGRESQWKQFASENWVESRWNGRYELLLVNYDKTLRWKTYNVALNAAGVRIDAERDDDDTVNSGGLSSEEAFSIFLLLVVKSGAGP